MLEFIVYLFALVFLISFAIEYFIGKKPLKESVEHGLFMGIFLTALIIAFEQIDQSIVTDYQLIVIGIVAGIAIFSLKFVFGYYVFKRPLKEPVKDGLIKGSTVAILISILVKSRDLLIFLYDLIV